MELKTFEKAELIVEEIRATESVIKSMEKAEMKSGWIRWADGEYIKPLLREKLLTTMKDYTNYLECKLKDIQDERQDQTTVDGG